MNIFWYKASEDGSVVLSRCEQLDGDGKPIPGQEEVPENDPRVQAILNPEKPE